MEKEKRESVLYSSFQQTEEGKKELYEYSKNKVGDVSSPANHNSLTGLPALRLFFYTAGEIIHEHPDKKYGLIVMDDCVIIGLNRKSLINSRVSRCDPIILTRERVA